MDDTPLAAAASCPGPALPPAVQALVATRIRNHDLRLPVLDTTTQKVISLCNDPDAGMADLARLVTQNQSLAAHLLRIANTPAYAPREPIVSLPQAISRLGMKKIREISLVIALQQARITVPGFETDLEEITEASLAGALFAQEIARSRRWNVEESFLCGLLRNIGQPVALDLLVTCIDAAEAGVEPGLVRCVAARIHPVIGSSLIGSWKLPARVAESVRYQFTPEQAPTTAGTAHATALCDALASWLLAGSGERAALHAHPALVPLNLYPDELDAVLDKAPEITRTLRGLTL